MPLDQDVICVLLESSRPMMDTVNHVKIMNTPPQLDRLGACLVSAERKPTRNTLDANCVNQVSTRLEMKPVNDVQPTNTLPMPERVNASTVVLEPK